MIGSISYSTSAKADTTASRLASATGSLASSVEGQGSADHRDGDSLTLSPLARQLAASATHADNRDKALTRSELADVARRILDDVIGDSYYANKATHDAEVPDTSDPELLSRAAQATEYINDVSQGGHRVRNPFAGLSRDQLADIVYDESGSYTVNERHAAWRESYDQEQAWRQKVVAEGMAEYSRTGKMTSFFASVLDHFNSLPAIEQAQYPNDYALDLQYKIDLDFNYRTGVPGGSEEAPTGLISVLLQQSIEGS